jgi:hypothetical protein
MCSYCSQVAPLEQTFERSGRRNRVRECDVDKICETIMGSSSFSNCDHNDHNLEKNLDQLGLELTTDLVLNVLGRLHFEEKTSFRFFMWAGHQKNYSHEPCAYNEMIDILTSTKYKAKQFRIVCDMLDYMKRNNKNVVPVEVLLTILRNYTEKYLTESRNSTRRRR